MKHYFIYYKKYECRKFPEKGNKKNPKQFGDNMGISVDIAKIRDGNTNDRNLSSRFFSAPVISSHTTGIHINLIKTLRVILETIQASLKLTLKKFKEYAINTARYVGIYSWHSASPNKLWIKFIAWCNCIITYDITYRSTVDFCLGGRLSHRLRGDTFSDHDYVHLPNYFNLSSWSSRPSYFDEREDAFYEYEDFFFFDSSHFYFVSGGLGK